MAKRNIVDVYASLPLGSAVVLHGKFYMRKGPWPRIKSNQIFEDVDLSRTPRQCSRSVVLDTPCFYNLPNCPSVIAQHGDTSIYFLNHLALYHIASCLKYSFKWRWDFILKLIIVLCGLGEFSREKTPSGYFLDFFNNVSITGAKNC